MPAAAGGLQRRRGPMPTQRDQVEEPAMPQTGDGPVPAWLTGLGLALLAWAVYYVYLAVR